MIDDEILPNLGKNKARCLSVLRLLNDLLSWHPTDDDLL